MGKRNNSYRSQPSSPSGPKQEGPQLPAPHQAGAPGRENSRGERVGRPLSCLQPVPTRQEIRRWLGFHLALRPIVGQVPGNATAKSPPQFPDMPAHPKAGRTPFPQLASQSKHPPTAAGPPETGQRPTRGVPPLRSKCGTVDCSFSPLWTASSRRSRALQTPVRE